MSTIRTTTAASLPIVTLLWAGIVLGISFIEAPSKFLAPSLTLPVGLDVGRHVFAASHVAQLVLAALAAGAALVVPLRRSARVVLATAVATLLVQLLVLMPALDERARTIIAGGTPAGWSPHLPYVLLEVLKLALLTTFAARAITRPLPGGATPATPA